MWEKIKEFFQNKWVKLTVWILMVIGTVAAIAGVTSAEVSGAITLTFAIVIAVGDLTAWMLMVIGTVTLAIARVMSTEVSDAITLTFAIVIAVGAIAAYIIRKLK